MIPLKDDNPTRTFPAVTLGIIGLNILFFLYEIGLSPAQRETFFYQLGAIPFEITHLVPLSPQKAIPLPASLFTAMFVHGGFVHLAGNMLYLWVFGNNIEDALGHGKFIAFYFLVGLIASFSHILSAPDSPVPMVGASGAIAGILGAYVYLFPRARIRTLVIFFFFISIVRIPAILVLGVWFLVQILNAGGGGGVAWYAHIGGFLAGLFLIIGFSRRRGFRRPSAWE
ncbi:MAG: rhomboid family intramembrane serine protease [Candidatus Tectomicrobia bacterium]|uniref:Rhomboid family intramembrane serine protease n=1 Tax=Tectimicrobiota bacterium TaxID=2528274 RepID=A0A932M1E0_UNCTE|nr:rhomboid family intramembrane serine protease [Candidatus Tectomicrobia bacterium]